MKTIKYIIQFSILLFAINAIAQYSSTNPISTPFCTLVSVEKYVGTDLSSLEKSDLKLFWEYQFGSYITFQSEATYKYNCHAYAWAGISSVKMTAPEQEKYWIDGSYTRVATQSAATKVWYGGGCWGISPYSGGYGDRCDHSAITTGTTDYFISKWGEYGPLFYHHKDYSPYLTSNIKYYTLTPYPLFYIGNGSNCGFSGNGTYNFDSSGYLGTALHAYASSSSPTSYSWSVSAASPSLRYYLYPSGNKVDLSVYLNAGYSGGGTLRIECAMYNGGTLLGTGTYYMNIY